MTPYAGKVPEGYAAFKQYQKMFNVDNGLRIHERGGAKDVVVYNVTVVLLVIGGVLWTRDVYKMIKPH